MAKSCSLRVPDLDRLCLNQASHWSPSGSSLRLVASSYFQHRLHHSADPYRLYQRHHSLVPTFLSSSTLSPSCHLSTTQQTTQQSHPLRPSLPSLRRHPYCTSAQTPTPAENTTRLPLLPRTLIFLASVHPFLTPSGSASATKFVPNVGDTTGAGDPS